MIIEKLIIEEKDLRRPFLEVDAISCIDPGVVSYRTLMACNRVEIHFRDGRVYLLKDRRQRQGWL